MYNLLQIEIRYKKRYIENTRETSIETPGIKLPAVVIFKGYFIHYLVRRGGKAIRISITTLKV